MTVITKITARGFKSFAPKTELLFGNGFNCVLGPNGAGKSNLVDAICFVLGKISARSLRAEKSANLIYNGGKKGNPAKEAEVSIEFDNSKKTFPLKDKSIKISRLVKQNGTSIYKINSEARTRQQVVDLLGAAKIDPDGHNIILQGDIVHFMEMKTDERRKIIEEIAGISVYEGKKEKCLHELEKVDTKLNEATIILNEREINLRELKKERDQAIKFKNLQEEIKNFKATGLHIKIKNKKEAEAKIMQDYSETQKKLESTEKEINLSREKINSLKEEIKKINNEIEKKGEREQIILRKQISDLKTTIIQTNSRLDACKTELERIKQRKLNLQETIKETENKMRELDTQKKQSLKNKESLLRNEDEINRKICRFKEKQGIKDISKGIDDLETSIDKKLAEISDLQLKKHELIKNQEVLAYKISALDERIKNIKGLGSGEEIKKLQQKRKELKENTLKLSKLSNEDVSLTAQLNKARQKIVNLNEEHARLQTKNISAQEITLSNLAVKKIITSKLEGVYGTISELGKVTSKHSLALGVAAGSRINSIVVSSDIIAQKCIEYLKQNKLGVATFLPLNKIKERAQNIESLSSLPGVEGLAINLIEFDRKFFNAFSYIFGSTLIVKDINTARRIGIGRARMVTLEGDLIEPSGAMVGGFRAIERTAGFKEKEIIQNIKKLEQEIKEARNIISLLENKKSDNEAELIKIKELKSNLSGEIIVLEKSLNLTSNIEEIIKEKDSLAEQRKKLENEIKPIEKNIEIDSKEIEKLKLSRDEIKKAITNPEINKELQELEDEKSKIKESIINFDSGIKNINLQIQNILQPELEKTLKIIKQHDKETEEFAREAQNLNKIILERQKELKAKEKEEQEFYGKFKELAAKRAKMQEQTQKIETAIIREDEKRRIVEKRINNIFIDKAKVTAEIESLENEFENYKDGTIKRGLLIEEINLKTKEFEKELSQIGNVNLRALEVYDEIEKELTKLVEKVSKLKIEKEDVLNMMTEVESNKKETFMKTYKVIANNFKQIFNELYVKGEGHFELEDPEDPFSGGLDIKVKIIGNKYMDIKSLSGGEKTMAALSFIFAIQEYKPSSFYLLDEVDASLDKKNSEVLSKLIMKYAKKAQYIVISHNDQVITEADQIYGVSMKESISKVLSLKI